MSKYKMLVNVLDSIRREAPDKLGRYAESDNTEKNNHARSLAYIHLFLKAYFNLSSFEEREKYIVDGSYDGGIDAYYIDRFKRKIYFIQSKFRTTENNYEDKEISIDEIVSMNIGHILDGNKNDINGNKYNGKILTMQRLINEIDDLPRYKYEVMLLANLKDRNIDIVKKIIGYTPKIINYEVAYEQLLFPVIKGTCHMADDIIINLNVNAKNTASLDYSVNTEGMESNVQLFFIPTFEIARIMSEFKNSILEYNPRSYLGMKNNNVNDDIRKSIIERDSNEFSLFNNGITILSNETLLQTRTGKSGEARLCIKNPQIINGGQTANTLANIYEDNNIDNKVFNNKEVLTKVITFNNEFENTEDFTNINKLRLIEDLSRATNLQNKVTEADRRSNDEVQIHLQDYIYKEFGYCYNRKYGEFYDGIKSKYISNEKIIPRDIFLRVACSIYGEVASSRRSSEDVLFRSNNFDKFLNMNTNFHKVIYGYFVYKELDRLDKQSTKDKDKYYMNDYGNALRYGKYAVINASIQYYKDNVSSEELESFAQYNTSLVLNKWKVFENSIANKSTNSQYFLESYDEGTRKVTYNYDGYYKGRTINNDLSNYSFLNK